MDGSTNLIGIWTKVETSGTMTVNATSKSLTITPAGDGTVQTTARQSIDVGIGKKYLLTWELQTSAQMWRTIGTSPGGTAILGANVSTVPESRVEFTPQASPIWIDYFRKALNSTTVGSIRLEEVPPGSSFGRRLNGRNQCFTFDANAAGARADNSLQYIGGWFKFQYTPTTAAYLFDGAVTGVGSLGQERMRIIYDPGAGKIAASTGGVSSYLEKYVSVPNFSPDVWHYVGIVVKADRTIDLVYDQTIGGTSTGETPSAGQYLKMFMIGARNSSTTSSYSPAIIADWVWCAGFVPTNDQIVALAQGYRPSDIDGFEPTYYWKMDQSTSTEPSLTTTGSLTAVNTAPLVVGPYYLIPPSEALMPLMFF